jgi:hypothetical protein
MANIEPRRIDSDFIDFAEFFHDFVHARLQDRLHRSSIANRCSDNKERG